MTYGILTPDIANDAVELLRPRIVEFLRGFAKRTHLAIVVTAVEAINPIDPGKSFKDNCYLIAGIGDQEDWQYDYERVALSKAELSVRTGIGTYELAPHYRLSGDTVYSGSVVIDGIIVACSGVEGYFDEMIAGWIAVTIKGLCKHKHAQIPKEVEFIN